MPNQAQLFTEIHELIELILRTTQKPSDPQMVFAKRCLLYCLERRLDRLK